MYPQYAASTTASALDAVYAWTRTARRMPALRAVDAFHDHPAYIRALAACVNDYWMKHGRPDKLVLSFHGVPRRSLDLGDPYHCHCHKTARLLAAELGLEKSQYVLTFQSRFGKAEWLQPYTAETLARLPGEGVKRVDVFCPGFVADCLETLEEIGIEGKATFIEAGGTRIPRDPLPQRAPRLDRRAGGPRPGRVVRAGWPRRPTPRRARRRCSGRRRWARPADATGPAGRPRPDALRPRRTALPASPAEGRRRDPAVDPVA